MPNFKKPARWMHKGNSIYYTCNTKHGVKYMCSHCGMKNLGFGSIINHETGVITDHNHRKDCPFHAANKQD